MSGEGAAVIWRPSQARSVAEERSSVFFPARVRREKRREGGEQKREREKGIEGANRREREERLLPRAGALGR